jgi:hypothetical protein
LDEEEGMECSSSEAAALTGRTRADLSSFFVFSIIRDLRAQSGTNISIADPDPATPDERVVTITVRRNDSDQTAMPT